jgi:predicted heme/steroid binding protein
MKTSPLKSKNPSLPPPLFSLIPITLKTPIPHHPNPQTNEFTYNQRGPLLLTPAQLSLHNGTATHDHSNLPIYLSINGTIFDVSASPHTYGPGGSYHVFAGRDATRAFVTGCFQTDITGDLRDVERMFIPVEDVEGDEEEGKWGGDEGVAGAQRKGGGGEGGIVKLTTKAQRKIRAEQERREARKRVHREVDKWLRFYREHGKYFEVGRLVADDGDAEGLAGKAKEGVRYEGEVPALCEAAERARPKRSQLNAAAASAAGGGGSGSSDGQGKKVFRTKKTGEGGEKDGKPV